MTLRPTIAITMGDPTGIGPEVTARALVRQAVWDCCRPLVIGDAAVIGQALTLLDNPLTIHRVSAVNEAGFDPDVPDVLDLRNVDLSTLQPGKVSAAAGHASVEYVEKAVELAQAGEVDGITTGPINKAALQAAGIPHIGHTEILAALTGEERLTTMLATNGLKVVHVTRHAPLQEVASAITRERVLETIRLTDAGLRTIGIERPTLAVAALNPHGGDDGLLGREEKEQIGPAVASARAEGIEVQGPIPADSVFFRAIRGEFDAVVAMYHDQGHIPIKTHGFERSVTVTLGLPIIRTSVDHGTAFDIAWRGLANEESLVQAVQLAAQMAAGR